MATYGRYKEIELFLKSLIRQTYNHYELIIIDQNDQIDLKPLIERFQGEINIKHLYGEKGLSKSRNYGLKYIEGDIIGFPDDDCVYKEDTLEKVLKSFQIGGVKGVIGKSVDSFSNNVENSELKRMNIYSIWFHGISYTIFLHKEVIKKVGIFDEELGIGSGTKYGSGEETDYLIRSIQHDQPLYYDSSLEIIHPTIDITKKESSIKAYNYSVGRMFVLKKHDYNRFFVFLNIIYPLVKLGINILRKPKTSKYFWFQFLGRIQST